MEKTKTKKECHEQYMKYFIISIGTILLFLGISICLWIYTLMEVVK